MAPVRLPSDAELPLLRARVSDLADRALVVGDPGRAARVAERLDDVRQLTANREYHVYAGSYRGVPVTIASHGVGAAGAAVCFEELARGGVTRIIRSGTAGGIQPEVVDGAIVVATGAVRAEGVSHQLVPSDFPAIATPDLTIALREAAGRTGLDVHTGIVLTGDMFYPSDVITGIDHQLWQRAGVVAVEMEAAALFVIASLNGIESGAVFAIDGNPLAAKNDSMDGYDPYREIVTQAVDGALTTALDVLVS
ncbi:nucleoside phosphorylase [Leucobacter sp. CSA2]|uniref:Uridine phosphorylase n=1 Tax=Leucobacter edaphi TaxID=2796472 RepID=A0A934UXR1_9MICO|nr:nucleoside phosphorylase [Leucobacter edaphi]MBK0421593.1 nucleoside phosphorylase [Leucobacter edaphi]